MSKRKPSPDIDDFLDSFLEEETESYEKKNLKGSIKTGNSQEVLPNLVKSGDKASVNKIREPHKATDGVGSDRVSSDNTEDDDLDSMLADMAYDSEAELLRASSAFNVGNDSKNVKGVSRKVDNIIEQDEVVSEDIEEVKVGEGRPSKPYDDDVDNDFVSDSNIEDTEDYDNDYYSSDDLDDEGLSEKAQAILDWEPPEPKSIPGRVINEWITTGWIGLMHLDFILTEAIITGSSDLHLTADQTISMSRNGDIIRYDDYIVPDEEIMHILIHNGILSHQEQAEFNTEYEYDGAYTMQYGPYKGTRTRINIGRTFGKYFIVFRIINDVIPSLQALDVEQEIIDWSYYPNGLFMLCGPTGTGKSTTLASVVNNLQHTTRKKIISIEKPVEYIYPDDTPSLVVQREVGGDTRGFYEGLTSAMRQNPDVILLGEVRNTEEVTELLRAAETGHLAISTMHTNSVATTINRIQNLFSGNEQRRIMSTLADTLRGIGNQVLVKDLDDGRFAVRELLTINQEIKELITAGDVMGIRAYQVAREATMEHKLAAAAKSGKCLRSEALKHAADPIFFNELMDKSS